MSEPKWWPKGVVPTDAGYYLQKIDNATYGTSIPQDRGFNKDSQFYGPIPEPPKEPPKLRRFTATMKGERVSGCCIVEHWCSRMFQVFKNGRDGAYYAGIFHEEDVSDIQWLDKE